MTTAYQTIEPCKCGTKGGLVISVTIDGGADKDYVLYCEECKASSKLCNTREEAIAAWNTMQKENETENQEPIHRQKIIDILYGKD